MRIAQVVAYESEDAAYGGPVAVARAQCSALAARGHEVGLFATGPVEATTTDEVDGYTRVRVPAKFWMRSALKFGGLSGPGLLGRVKEFQPDVVHVHVARDFVTAPIARTVEASGAPVVLQTHGMIVPTSRLLARVFDAVITRHMLLRASTTLCLTRDEVDALRELAPTAPLRRIANGVTPRTLEPLEGREASVIFLSRLHPRKRPRAFVEMAALLAPALPHTDFVIAGPDEGEASAVNELIARLSLQDRVRTVGAIPPAEVPLVLARARVLVLPSRDEVFPMVMLEAFQSGTPVVCTDSLGIAELCARFGAAVVTDGTVEALAQGVMDALGNSAEELREGARELLRSELDIAKVAETLESIYIDAQTTESEHGT